MFSSAEAQVSAEDGVRFTFNSGSGTAWACFVTGELNPESCTLEFYSVATGLRLGSRFVSLILDESDLLLVQVLNFGSCTPLVEVSCKVLLPGVHANVLHEELGLTSVIRINGNGSRDLFNLLVSGLFLFSRSRLFLIIGVGTGGVGA